MPQSGNARQHVTAKATSGASALAVGSKYNRYIPDYADTIKLLLSEKHLRRPAFKPAFSVGAQRWSYINLTKMIKLINSMLCQRHHPLY
jgi:hypothetical protein